MKQSLFLASLSLLTPIYSLSASSIEPGREKCLVTIFVHGTLKPAEVSLSTLHQVMHSQKNLKATLYSETLKYMRTNSYLFRNSATQDPGLRYIDPAEGVCKAGAQTLSEIFEIQHEFYHEPIKTRRYYTFGWDGALSLARRLEEARTFYDALEKEVLHLRSLNWEPEIHVLGYSHGGNVALNLARVKDERDTEPVFSVDRLVLLATPIQKETDYLVAETAFFKKVYLFYSTEDNVQTSDVFSTRKELFSGYRFTNHAYFTIPSTLTQIRFRLTKTIKRSSKLSDPDAKPEEILSEKKIRCVHMDPGHVEFWNLQWGSYWYRPQLPISPLPVVAFVPTILYLLEHNAIRGSSVTFDYCPSVHGARISTTKSRDHHAVPVLSADTVARMKSLVKVCVPEDFSFEEQQKQEYRALDEAHESLNKRASKRSREKLDMSYQLLTHELWPHQFPKLQKIAHRHLLRT